MQETTRKYKGKQEWEFSAICTSVCWKIKLSLRVESVLEVALKKMIFELDLKQLVGIVILEHKKVLKKKKRKGWREVVDITRIYRDTEWKKGVKKLKLNIQKPKIMASSPTTSWQIDEEKWKQWQILFSWSPKSLQTMTATMKLKYTCSLEEKLWQI